MSSSENFDKLNALNQIKQAKELLDIGAITEEEFHEIKSKFLKQLNNSNSPQKGPAKSNENKKECSYDTLYSSIGTENNERDDVKKTKSEKLMKYISCPNCGEKIVENAIRCKYCKTMLKIYPKDISQISDETIVRKKSNKIVTHKKTKNARPLLEDDFQKHIEDNLGNVCNIFNIPNLGKKFVINKLTNEFTQEEIIEKLNKYSTVPNEESERYKKINDKKDLINNKIRKIPKDQLKIFFVISGRPPRSKKEFIKAVEMYWNYDIVKKFYEEYLLFLKQGFQEKDFKKVIEHDIEETYRIFSISQTKQMLGKNHTVRFILNTINSEDIKEKLDSHFGISHSMYEEFIITEEDKEMNKSTNN